MSKKRLPWSWIGLLVLASSHARAQPAAPPDQGAPPPPAAAPDQAPGPAPPAPPSPPTASPPPPPQPPPAQWAPPLPGTPPPAAPAPIEHNAPPALQPPSETPPEQIAESANPSSEIEVYGHAMLDIGYDFGHIGDPAWQDVLRPTKLPAFADEYGRGGRTFEGVRQSRFGVAAKTPTAVGEIYAKFEFELFGVGNQAGETTFRIRHAYGEWNGLLAGQTWSPFMDPDVFPDSVEYWGPPGMVFFRNVQLAYFPYKTETSNIVIALERPGASADTDNIDEERFDLTNVVPRFPAPDVSAHVRWGGKWGHLQLGGIFRYMKWDDLAPTPVIQGHAFGWGVNASANVRIKPALLKLQFVGGRAIENYMNDATFDLGPRIDGAALEGETLPVIGVVAFADFAWTENFTSTAGYSLVWIHNSDGQAPDDFHMGQYALANLLCHPVKSLFFGPELQWARRSNNSDGFSVNDYRLQFSIKYSFSATIGGKQ